MERDEELKEARDFTYNFTLEYMDIDGVDCPKIDSIADLALAYHHHRLESNKVIETLKKCYRKHHLGDDDIGWSELSSDLFETLVGILGDADYNKFIKESRVDNFDRLYRQNCLPEPPKEMK